VSIGGAFPERVPERFVSGVAGLSGPASSDTQNPKSASACQHRALAPKRRPGQTRQTRAADRTRRAYSPATRYVPVTHYRALNRALTRHGSDRPRCARPHRRASAATDRPSRPPRARRRPGARAKPFTSTWPLLLEPRTAPGQTRPRERPRRPQANREAHRPGRPRHWRARLRSEGLAQVHR
jgi:hypothetical protein